MINYLKVIQVCFTWCFDISLPDGHVVAEDTRSVLESIQLCHYLVLSLCIWNQPINETQTKLSSENGVPTY